jgi:hypothetical protein
MHIKINCVKNRSMDLDEQQISTDIELDTPEEVEVEVEDDALPVEEEKEEEEVDGGIYNMDILKTMDPYEEYE